MPAAAKPKPQKMYAANTSFSIDLPGNPGYVVRRGDLFAADDKVVKQVPAFFDEAEEVVRVSVEKATKAPGESR